MGSQKTLGVMPKNTQYVATGGLIDTLSSNEKSGRFQNSPNFLGTYNHSSSLSNTQPLQHTASFKEGRGSSGSDTPDGQLHMSFKPSAVGNSFITLRPVGVPQLLMPSLDSATSASEVRI